MKKIALILAAALVIGIGLSACKTTTSCPAYGEAHKYQKETRY